MHSGTKFLLTAVLFFSFIWFFFHWLLPFLFPFLLGLGLALSAEPLVKRFCRLFHAPRGLGAGVGVSCTSVIVSALLFLILALLLKGLSCLSQILPDLSHAALSGLQLLEQWFLSLSQKAPVSIRSFLSKRVLAFFSDGTAFLDQGARYILSLAGGALSQIPGRAFTLFTALISGFMISARLPFLRDRLRQQLSGDRVKTILRFLRSLRSTAGHWVLAQLKLAGITFLILTLGFILMQVPYAPIWAIFIALLDALPVLGTGIVLIPWSLISFLQSNTVQALGLLGIYASAALTRSVLEPRFVGRQLGLDPLVTLISIYAGYRLWGFGGMILSPLLAVTLFRLIPQASENGKSS